MATGRDGADGGTGSGSTALVPAPNSFADIFKHVVPGRHDAQAQDEQVDNGKVVHRVSL